MVLLETSHFSNVCTFSFLPPKKKCPFDINIQTWLWCTWWWRWCGTFVGLLDPDHFKLRQQQHVCVCVFILTLRLFLCLPVNPVWCIVRVTSKTVYRCIICSSAHWTPRIHGPLCRASACKHLWSLFFCFFFFCWMFSPSKKKKAVPTCP